MNKLSLAICGMLIVVATLCSAEFTAVKSKAEKSPSQIKSIVLEEGFEGDLVPPAGWTIADADSDGHNWRYDAAFAPHTGLKAISSDSYIENLGALTPDNFLITPPISIPVEKIGNINYWVCAQNGGWSYEHYAVMISTTGTNPSDFTTTLFEETIEAKDDKYPSTWQERNVEIPLSYAGKTVYIAFRHYNCTDMYALNLDDVKIAVDYPDIPVINIFGPVSGATAEPSYPMDISVVINSQIDIDSVICHYKLTGQTAWSEIPMSLDRFNGIFRASLPAQSNSITGMVKFTATDISSPPNTYTSMEYNIAWISEPEMKWMEWGENYDTNSGIGVASAPWRAGVDFDFGTTAHWHPSALKLAVSSPMSVHWVIRKATQINFTTILLGDLVENFQGTIYCNGVHDIVPTISAIEDSTKNLTSHVALVFDMPPQSYITLDIQATSEHTYVNTVQNDTLKTITSLAPQFPGAWFMGIKVRKMCGIGEETEILPGSSQLNQNYPNPFNPSTTISFYNNMGGNVKLTVLNAKGETVATLTNGKTSAGNHKVVFDGSKFNSGVYFYKLETPTAVITKKMMLIK